MSCQIKIGWRQNLIPILPCRNRTVELIATNYAEADIKAPVPCSILLDFFTQPDRKKIPSIETEFFM